MDRLLKYKNFNKTNEMKLFSFLNFGYKPKKEDSIISNKGKFVESYENGIAKIYLLVDDNGRSLYIGQRYMRTIQYTRMYNKFVILENFTILDPKEQSKILYDIKPYINHINRITGLNIS